MDNNKLDTITNLFEGKEIRSIWNSEKEDYFFSVVDVISALTDSKIPKRYWSDLKRIILKELFTGGRGSDNYYIFIFSDEWIDFRSYEEVEREDQFIIMSYRKGFKEILKNYTKIDIENMI